MEHRISKKEPGTRPMVRVWTGKRFQWLECDFMMCPPRRRNNVGLMRDLEDRGVAGGYDKYVLQLEPILQDMQARGVPVSPARHAEVKTELERRLNEADAAMQAFIPDDVRTCTPKLGYKREPKDTTGLVRRWFDPTPEACDPGVRIERWCRLTEWTPSHTGLIRYMRYKGHPIPTDYKTGKET